MATRDFAYGTQDQKDYLAIQNELVGFGVNIIDRSGYLTMPYNYKSILPLPKLSYTNASFAELCIARANELHQKSQEQNLPLLVLYSGGIDSTCVLTALIKTATSTDHIKVCMNSSSIKENGRFYYQHILNKFETVPSERMYDYFDGSHIVVAGEGADQIFGTDIYFAINNTLGLSVLNEAYSQENVLNFFNIMGVNARAGQVWYHLMNEQIKAVAPCEIKTFKDFWWWYNFCYKWQTVYFRVFSTADARVGISKAWFDQCYANFFMTEDFQTWSISNPDKKIGDTWASYKQVAKDFIFSYNKDQEYQRLKTKVASLPSVLNSGKQYIGGIDSDYNILPANFDIVPYVNRENSFVDVDKRYGF
jgi:hypothetical protein